MLNAERFKKKILENSNVVFDFSMSKDKHTIKKCLGVCNDCFFHEAGNHCSNIKVKWLLSEYKEPIKLSKVEYEILKHVQKEGFNFITRSNSDYLYGDLYGNLFIYEIKPIKHDGIAGWCTTGKSYVLYAFSDLFNFVKWEDSEPTSIEYVLKNCEVVNDAEE